MVSDFFHSLLYSRVESILGEMFLFSMIFFTENLINKQKNAWTNVAQPMVVVGSLASTSPYKAHTHYDSIPPLPCLPTKSSAIRSKSCKVPWADRRGIAFCWVYLGQVVVLKVKKLL